jgi:hypothetical protein
MAVLAGVPPEKAVSWVREHYHRRAVKTPVQEEWVRWFAQQIGDSSGLAQGK